MPRDRARPLDPALIAREAVALVDQGGLSDLTMRRLAARLAVDPMALYRHVTDKSALLRLMSDAILTDVLDELLTRPDQDVVVTSATHLYRHLVAHPGRLAVLATSATTVASATYSLRLARELASHGLEEERAVECLRALTAYVFGAALLAVSEQDDGVASPSAADVADRLQHYGDPVDTATAERLLAMGLRADFVDGLEAVLHGFRDRP